MAHKHEPTAAPYEPIAWASDHMRLLDQTLLPNEIRYLELDSVERVAEAITTMRVRGAPAIGITAAYGLALAAMREPGGELATIRAALEAASTRLDATRPNAVDIRWALERVGAESTAAEVRAAALDEAHAIHEEQHQAVARMAESGDALLPAGGGVLTLCNTGPLATGGGGTALGVIAAAWRAGRA